VQERNNYSLLWWMRRVIALYKRQNAFGRGTIEFLHPENRKIFTCIRRWENEIILVVANLSRFVQPVELDLAAFQSLVPVELFGRTEFPPISDKPYFLTLSPHSFYWFSLEVKTSAETKGTPVGAGERPVLDIAEDWGEIFDEQHHYQLERALQSWLPSRRWFGGKARKIKSVRVQEIIRVSIPSAPASTGERTFFTFLVVEFLQGDPDTYILPLACAMGEPADIISRDSAPLVIARLNFGNQNKTGVLYDAVVNKDFCRALLELISKQQTLEGKSGMLEATATPELEIIIRESGGALEPSVVKAEQSNSSVIFGEKLILKFFRRLDYGTNPDLEIIRFLTAQKFPYTPALAGALEYRSGRDEPRTVAILSSFVPKARDAWDYTLDALGKFFERVQTLPPEKREPQLPVADVTKLAANEMSEQAKHLLDTYIESARLLGERTAAMHLALASETDNRGFVPEPFTPHAQRGLYQSMRNMTRQNLQLLSRQLKTFPPEIQVQAQQVLSLEPEIQKKLRQIYERGLDAARIRQHGDYHLGQVLYTGKEFLIIDFEGEPAVPISERRLKRSPLQDVTSMMRSFHYAAYAALLKHVERGTPVEEQLPQMILWARFWARWTGALFFKAYVRAAGPAPFFPSKESDLQMMTEIFLLRKAIYELGYELNNRPDWVTIPLQGILELVGEGKTS